MRKLTEKEIEDIKKEAKKFSDSYVFIDHKTLLRDIVVSANKSGDYYKKKFRKEKKVS